MTLSDLFCKKKRPRDKEDALIDVEPALKPTALGIKMWSLKTGPIEIQLLEQKYLAFFLGNAS